MTNQGKNNINLSLESTEISLYVYNNILCHTINVQMTSWQRHIVRNFTQNFSNSKLNLLVTVFEKWITETNFIDKRT